MVPDYTTPALYKTMESVFLRGAASPPPYISLAARVFSYELTAHDLGTDESLCDLGLRVVRGAVEAKDCGNWYHTLPDSGGTQLDAIWDLPSNAHSREECLAEPNLPRRWGTRPGMLISVLGRDPLQRARQHGSARWPEMRDLFPTQWSAIATREDAREHTWRTDVNRRARPRQPIQPTPPGPGAPPPHTGHHPRPLPPPSDPPRQGPDHPPGLVSPTRGLDQAHRQSPPGPDHPRQRPQRDHSRPRALASPQTHPGPAHLDPPRRVGPGPDARHRQQRHALRDRTPTAGPSGDGPPSGPEPPGAVGTGHRAQPRHRPPRRRPPHPGRQPPPPTYRQ